MLSVTKKNMMFCTDIASHEDHRFLLPMGPTNSPPVQTCTGAVSSDGMRLNKNTSHMLMCHILSVNKPPAL